MSIRMLPILTVASLAFVHSSSAAIHTIDWLSMNPTSFNAPVPNNSNFILPGVGNVTLSYSISSNFSHVRADTSLANLPNGSVTSGPDTYMWGAHEQFAALLNSGPDPLVPEQWSITYTFPSTIPAGRLILGVSGLGQTTSFGGGATIASVQQSGTMLGDYTGGNNWGPTQFSGGIGSFSMQNSVNGVGGADPHWNTPLAIVRIDDAVSSLTVNFAHIRGDGAGVNIGYVPAPAGAAVLTVAAFAGGLRRRRTDV